MHFDNATDTLGLAGKCIEHAVAFLQPAGIDAGKGQCTVTIVHDLERECAQGPVRVDNGDTACFVAFEVNFGLRHDFHRVRQIVNYSIKNILYSLVFKSRATEGREEV